MEVRRNMVKPQPLKAGDTVVIVSLSSGLLGEAFCSHNIAIGKKRLEDMGLNVKFSKNSLKGMEFLKEHPKARADDLKEVFLDHEIKAVICAIGGEDTYRLLPYLLEDQEFKDSVLHHPKIFTGFSDTTINHLMFYKLGLTTYYGPNFMCDISEISDTMLPYTEREFCRYLGIKSQRAIVPGATWYEERTDFSANAMGVNRAEHPDLKGFELLQGSPVFSGELLGGCLESMYEILAGKRFGDQPGLCSKYGIFPSEEEWDHKILFIETCEEKPSPAQFREELLELKKRHVFDHISGIIVGKPQDECYYEEYKPVLKEVVDCIELPIVYNVNFGHAYPRCVLPYGVNITVDAEKQRIEFCEALFDSL